MIEDLRRLRTLLSILSFFTALTAVAQTSPPLNPALLNSKWHAMWIACPNAAEKDAGVFYFRKEIVLPSVPAHLWVHVSADNRFLLHVNGAYAAEGPARGDLFHWRFETVDLAPLLHSGRNVLATIVWNFGSKAPVAQISNRTGFLMQSDSDDTVATDGSWLVKQEGGRGAASHDGAHGYYAAGPGERIDGREVDWNWDQPDTQGSTGWQPAITIGRAATRESQDPDNNWELVQDSLPPMEHALTGAGKPVRVDGLAALPQFPSAPMDIAPNSHITLLLDNGVLQTAYPELIVSGGRDSNIRLIYSEALYDAEGDKGNRNEIAGRHIDGIHDDFTSDGGSQRAFQPLWWRTWRYLQIEVTTKSEALHLDSLRAWYSAYPFKENARIESDIPELAKLWSTGWRTARLCAHETYMDAPYWEQMQYVGDTRIQALVSYAMSGDSRLARQAITNIAASITPEGLTQSRFPSSLPQFIPTFSLLWVDMLHDYWMYVDDEALVRHMLPNTRGMIDWYAAHQRPDGLLSKMTWWEFGDWTSGYPEGVPPQEVDGGSSFLTLQFIEAMKDASELEAKYGSPERVGQYQVLIRKATEGLNRNNWDDATGLYADTPTKKSYSQQANVLAVWLDVAPRERQADILRRILASKEQNSNDANGRPSLPVTYEESHHPPVSQMSYYFRFYLSRALEHTGMEDLYLDQLGPWYNMLRMGLSTWAEQPEPTRSDCHAWSASPNYDLLTVVAGIRPAAPGFAKVRVEPHLGKLTHLDAAMPHSGGDIQVNYKLDGKDWRAIVTLPRGLTGKFVWHGKEYPLHEGMQTFQLQGHS
jgi:alpha-L-rhamnosidase